MGEEKRRDETATEKGRETWWEKENADKKSKEERRDTTHQIII